MILAVGPKTDRKSKRLSSHLTTAIWEPPNLNTDQKGERSHRNYKTLLLALGWRFNVS
jgi:hypothetical protein